MPSRDEKLLDAAARGDFPRVEEVLNKEATWFKSKANVNCKNVRRCTAGGGDRAWRRVRACCVVSAADVSFCLSHARTRSQEGGETPLHIAALNGYTGVIPILLGANADINALTVRHLAFATASVARCG